MRGSAGRKFWSQFMRKNVAIVLSAVLLSFGALLVHHVLAMRDPADTFDVTEIHNDAASRQFAVTYRYHHANSSSEV